MLDLFDLTDKVALVTGGGQGIGLGISTGLAKAGASIVIAARSYDKNVMVAEDLHKEYGIPTFCLHLDQRKTTSIKEMANKLEDKFGRVDILVNNAGINIRKMPQDFTEEEWDEVVDTNLKGAFFCCQAIYPLMKQGGGGKIINIGSLTSIVGSWRASPYASSKGGVLQMTRSLAVAWAHDNIQVNAILPGHVATPLTEQARKDFPGLNEHVLSRTPSGRWATPEDFEGPAIFLAGKASNFVSGAYVMVDGAYTQGLLCITPHG